jgi:hypothetical protein
MSKNQETPEEPEETPRGRWLTALVVAIILASVYAIALFLTGQGDTVPPTTVQAAVRTAVADGFQPMSVAFFDEMHGLISGAAPCAACSEQLGGIIASTSDGGRTWSIRFRGERPILGLSHIGRTSEVWATATVCDNESYIDCQLFRLHSSDLGQTWQQDRPKNLFMVSPPATDAACNEDHPFPISSSFVTPSRGWILCAMDPVSNTYQFKGLFESSDAGESWVQRAHFHPSLGGAITSDFGGMPIDGFAGGVSFLKSGKGWLWTVGPHSSLSTTPDSGIRWVPLWRPSDGSDRQVVGASRTSEYIGYVLVSSPSTGYWLLVTHDGGMSWEPAQSWPAPPAS